MTKALFFIGCLVSLHNIPSLASAAHKGDNEKANQSANSSGAHAATTATAASTTAQSSKPLPASTSATPAPSNLTNAAASAPARSRIQELLAIYHYMGDD